jgi:hypothetical protein
MLMDNVFLGRLNNMEKTANQILDLILERLKTYGPPAAAVGAGLAGLNHLVAMKSQRDQEVENSKKEDNTIYIDVPKVAGLFDTPSTSQYFLDSGLVAGSALAGGAVGYTVVNSILQNIRKRRMKSTLDKTKEDYAKLLSQKIYGMEEKEASEVMYPTIEALALAIHDSLEVTEDKVAFEKEALSEPTMVSLMTSLPGVGALITGILAHNYWYNKQKDIEVGLQKQEAESAKRAPAMIKLRTIQDQPEEEKAAGLMDNLGPAEVAAILAEEKKNTIPEDKTDIEKVYDPESTEMLDHNTVVVSTDNGDTQIDAVDPEAVKLLEKYKEVIARSLAAGVNINNKRRPKTEEKE